MRSGFTDVRAFVARSPTISREQLLRLAAQDADANIREASRSRLQTPSAVDLQTLIQSQYQDVWTFAMAQPGITPDQLQYIASQRSAGSVWQQLAAHPLLPPQTVAELVSRFVPRSRQVVDRPAEGYDSTDNYGSTYWVQTRAAEIHQEYAENDIALARQVIGLVPHRGDEVLYHLNRMNPELAGLIAHAPNS
jgi:hypothetical protein